MPSVAPLLAVVATAFGLSPAQTTAVSVDHVGVAAYRADGDALVRPGDTIDIDETLRNGGNAPLAGLTGRLPAVSAGQASVIEAGRAIRPSMPA